VDILSANGHPEPPVFQRIFWAATEGATAIALLSAGANAANANASLKALQAASIICGLPYILFYATLALYLAWAARARFGFWDPADLTSDGCGENFRRCRQTVRRRGRWRRLATRGCIAPERIIGRLPVGRLALVHWLSVALLQDPCWWSWCPSS
jgi:hypothetical protein